MWFIGVEVELETSAPPPKKILDPPLPGTAHPVSPHSRMAFKHQTSIYVKYCECHFRYSLHSVFQPYPAHTTNLSLGLPHTTLTLRIIHTVTDAIPEPATPGNWKTAVMNHLIHKSSWSGSIVFILINLRIWPDRKAHYWPDIVRWAVVISRDKLEGGLKRTSKRIHNPSPNQSWQKKS